MVVDFQNPRLQLVVNEDIEAQYLEAVSLCLWKLTIKLKCLLSQRVRLQSYQCFLAYFGDLLEEVISINSFFL